jgi:hypothetical protein
MIKYSRPVRMVLVAALVVAAGASYKKVTSPTRDWVQIARDAHYEIALDRNHVSEMKAALAGNWYQAFEVWYRTDHTQPRLHKRKKFDREIVRAIVLCDRLWFRVVSVDMSMGDGRVVARQRTSGDDLDRQAWRHVERGTTEEIAATAACHFGRNSAARESLSLGR